MNLRTQILIVLSSLFFAACNLPEGRVITGKNEKSSSAAEGIPFLEIKEQIFTPRCVSCHQQYDNYAGVYRELAAIGSAIDSNRMPKTGGPLSGEQKRLFRSWVDAGAPEFAGQVSAPAPVELTPDWTSIYDNIIAVRCLVCHNPNGQARFLDLSTREAFALGRDREFGGEKLIDTTNPEQSYLITIVRDEVEPMPPVSSNIRRLTEDEIQVLTEWIRRDLP